MERNFAKINFIGFVSNAIFIFAIFFMALYLKEAGFSGAEIGLLTGLFSITAIFTYFSAGVVNDVLTTRGVIIAGLFMFAVFLVGISLTASFFALVLLFLIGSAGKDIVRRTLENAVLKTSSEKKGRRFGTFMFFLTVGSAAGLLSGAFLVGFLDFKTVFVILAALMALMILPAITLEKIPVAIVKLGEYKKDLLNKKTLLLSALLFLFAMHWGAEYTSYSLFLKEGLGLNIFLIGVYMSIPIAIYGITSIYFGGKLDKAANYKKIFVSGLFASGIGHILMVNTNLIFSFLFRVLHEIGDGMADVTRMFWVSLIFSQERIGGDYGAVLVIMMLGAFTGSVIFGPIGELLGYGAPLIISGTIVVAEALLIAAYLLLFRRKS